MATAGPERSRPALKAEPAPQPRSIAPADGDYSCPDWPQPTMVTRMELSRSGLRLNGEVFPYYLDAAPIPVLDKRQDGGLPFFVAYLPVLVDGRPELGDDMVMTDGWPDQPA